MRGDTVQDNARPIVILAQRLRTGINTHNKKRCFEAI